MDGLRFRGCQNYLLRVSVAPESSRVRRGAVIESAETMSRGLTALVLVLHNLYYAKCYCRGKIGMSGISALDPAAVPTPAAA